MTNPLNDLMTIDHVVRVLDDGTITDKGFTGVYAPESYIGADWDSHGDAHVMEHHLDAWKDDMERAGWEYVRPQREFGRYGSPFMDPAEFIGEYNFGTDMRERPGYYVAVSIEMIGPESDNEDDGNRDFPPFGWAVLYREN